MVGKDCEENEEVKMWKLIYSFYSSRMFVVLLIAVINYNLSGGKVLIILVMLWCSRYWWSGMMSWRIDNLKMLETVKWDDFVLFSNKHYILWKKILFIVTQNEPICFWMPLDLRFFCLCVGGRRMYHCVWLLSICFLCLSSKS